MEKHVIVIVIMMHVELKAHLSSLSFCTIKMFIMPHKGQADAKASPVPKGPGD